MVHPRYIVLHKTEWERLQRQHKPEENKNIDKEEYLKSLLEKSQKWIESWPDSVQGHVRRQKKQKEQEQKERRKFEERAKKFVQEYQLGDNVQAVKKARELIFKDSCYGRQLWSAFLESKTLEERDIQLVFQNKLKQEVNIRKKEATATSLPLKPFNNREEVEKLVAFQRRQKNVEIAYFNKSIFEMQRNKNIAEREQQKQLELEDKRLLKKLLDREDKINTDAKILAKNETKEYLQQNAKLKELRTRREEEDERLREVWRKYQDRVRCKEKAIFKEMHKKASDGYSDKLYKLVQEKQIEDEEQFNKFVDKGIKSFTEKTKKRAETELKQKELERHKRKQLDEENKKIIELERLRRFINNNKCVCFKQTIIGKTDDKRKNNHTIKEGDVPAQNIFIRENKLLDGVKKCEKEATPWSSLKDIHAQFVEHASSTLRDCKYKGAARKVVENYHRTNCLDSKSLPVPEY